MDSNDQVPSYESKALGTVRMSESDIFNKIQYKTNIIDHFPYKPYETQVDCCNQIQQAIKDGFKDIILEAPTGSGKSPIAIAIIRWLEHELELAGIKKMARAGYIFTAQKILQDQYTSEFDYLACAKGRSNYVCLDIPGVSCNQGRCKSTKKRCGDCPYRIAIMDAADSHLTTLNYHLFLYVSKHKEWNPFDPRPILILDEAHEIEDILMGFVDLELTQRKLNKLGINKKIPDFESFTDYNMWLIELKEAIAAKMDAIEIYWKRNIDTVYKDKNQKIMYQKDMGNKDDLERLLFKIGILQNAIEFSPKDWVGEYIRDEEKLIAKPIYVHHYYRTRIMPFGGIRIYMSATISDYDTFCRNLGINKDDAIFVEMPHTFPIKNRMVYYTPSGKMSLNYKKDTLPIMMKHLTNIGNAYPDAKGIFHTFTWEIAEYIMNNINGIRDRLITHTTANRHDVLTEFKVSDEPLILVSPSMYTGVNLKDELSRFAVICKVPFPHLGDLQIKTRMRIDQNWYDWRTMCAILQAYGRSIRHHDDFAITYILDESFGWFFERVNFPEYFRDALRTI